MSFRPQSIQYTLNSSPKKIKLMDNFFPLIHSEALTFILQSCDLFGINFPSRDLCHMLKKNVTDMQNRG